MAFIPPIHSAGMHTGESGRVPVGDAAAAEAVRGGVALDAKGAWFRLWAPAAEKAWLVLWDEARTEAGRREIPMSPGTAGGWELHVSGVTDGKYYGFRLAGPRHDANAECGDPRAVCAVNSSRRARVTDLRLTDPPGWERDRHGPPLASPADAIIYELHVRDLTASPDSGIINKGKYRGWCEVGTVLPGRPDISTGLDHIASLGVTHVQLLPVMDFDGDEDRAEYFWGYMTAGFFSPEGSFASDPDNASRCRELKELIAALHRRGIGVVLDVVLNHTGITCPLEGTAPSRWYRRWPDGSLSNGSGCGNDLLTESPHGRAFVIECLKFWVREYGIDGFRFDLMALMDRETMVRAETELRALRPDLLLYGEPWAAESSPLQGEPMVKQALAGTGYGAFNDGFRAALKGSSDGADAGFIQRGWNRDSVAAGIMGTAAWAPQPWQSINYLTCHDNLTLHDKLAASVPGADDEALRRMALLGQFLVLISQGTPFLKGGTDFLHTKYGDPNSYRAPDAVNALRWSRKALHLSLHESVRALIALRRGHPLFRLRTRADVAARCRLLSHAWSDTLIMEIDGRGLPGESWRRALLLVNGSPDTVCAFMLPPGRWQPAIGEAPIGNGQCNVPPQHGVVLAEWRASARHVGTGKWRAPPA